MIATLSADIVRSTSLKTEDLIKLRNNLFDLFDDIARDYPGFWARIVRGDCIECFIPEYKYALWVAVLVKLFVKMQASIYDCSEMLQRYGIRFSIGMGELKYVSKKDDIINGPAIYISGRNLDVISRSSDAFSAVELDGAPQEVNCFLDSYVAMVSNMVDAYSAKQVEVVFYKLLGLKERDISKLLGIFQSSVNTRSTKAQWGLLNTAIRDFENMKFESLCG